MNTIKEFSTDVAAIKKWQTYLGLEADGVFGSQTKAATIKFQIEHKLVPDGVVGPATWAAAGEKVDDTGLPPRSSSASTDLEAYNIAKNAAPELTEAERQYVLAVGRGEGFYGKGWNPSWKPGSIEDQMLPLDGSIGTTGKRLDLAAARSSNNWGAVQGTGSAGSFIWIDHRANGSPYVYSYKRYKTPEEGFLSVANTLFKGGTKGAAGAKKLRDAINRGDLKTAVYTQRENGYYELAADKYYAAMLRNYKQMAANIDGFQDVLTAGGHFLLDWRKWAIIGTTLFGTVGAGLYFFKDKFKL